MVIHHDKLAYGKLAPESEELSENQIAEMLQLLNSSEEGISEREEEGHEKQKRDK